MQGSSEARQLWKLAIAEWNATHADHDPGLESDNVVLIVLWDVRRSFLCVFLVVAMLGCLLDFVRWGLLRDLVDVCRFCSGSHVGNCEPYAVPRELRKDKFKALG